MKIWDLTDHLGVDDDKLCWSGINLYSIYWTI